MRCSAIPEDLVAAQCAWERTYRSLADPANRQRTTALRRRLLELSVKVWWHPYWQQAGTGQRAALRSSARELEPGLR
ncbi:hypothetical protein OG840_29665 [Streptomyces sp. NBC_01764]|uniref:hypothetical protein n=1 Tax=Streptomyces sp. NBC_01764 TaxID=2975935 RepID=UPI002250E011|nr:hypothetical protein [Streptomyces sp. NBC_01764]MCX4405659.1 hypothetical protein [Streptomyces sp. NBC_01764]